MTDLTAHLTGMRDLAIFRIKHQFSVTLTAAEFLALVEVALAADKITVYHGDECDELFRKLAALGKAVEG